MDMVSSDEPGEFIELMWGIPSEFNQFWESWQKWSFGISKWEDLSSDHDEIT